MRLFLSLLNGNDVVPLSCRSSSEDVVVEGSMQVMHTSSQSASMVVAPLTGVNWREHLNNRQCRAIEWWSFNFDTLSRSIPNQVIHRWW